ncbi:hypothetical protein PG985_009329 [Apiospora marii]|uniref:uncharacterized protein n=1 Tax=Apiospora marii TaxID=335849 RepID=UPI0031315DD7
MSDSATVVRPKTFLDLPPEIRDVIYELVLVETPRHERRHTATCDWSKLPASHEKRSLLESIGTGSGIGPNPPVPCRCAKRKNLAILSVNRQIYNESSYVLWTKNVFSFDWVKDFNYWFADISAAKRNLIRHIAIYYVQGLIFPEETIEADDIDELQSNLLQCTDLRTLDLSPFCMYKEYIALLCRQLPLLQRLRMAGFVVVHSGHLGAAKSVPALAWGLVHEDIRIDDDEEVGVDIVDEEEEEEGIFLLLHHHHICPVPMGRRRRRAMEATHQRAAERARGSGPGQLEGLLRRPPLGGAPDHELGPGGAGAFWEQYAKQPWGQTE